LFGIVSLVGLGVALTASDARFLRVPPLTEITRACDFSDNVGFPFGRRRFYAVRNPAFAQAFATANQHRLWTDAIRQRDDWISGIAFVLLIVAAVIGYLARK
jgi:phosphoglycerol transferase MdoB-like AlkP superfamily enzyme